MPSPRVDGCQFGRDDVADTPEFESTLRRFDVQIVNGLFGVRRIVSMLVQRRYDVRALRADVVDGTSGAAVVSLVVATSLGGARLLERRLLREPMVVGIRPARLTRDLAATGDVD